MQTIKGLAFVAFSATLIFMLCAILLRRVARNQVALHAQQEALVAAERRATAGLLAHSVAHDMNNVLTVGMANVELLRSHGQMDESGSEMLNDIGISFERLHQMTRRMSHVGRAPSAGQAEEADLMDLVRREVAFMRRHRASTECTLHVQGPDHLKVRIHPEGMQDLLENLLLNAAEAAPENGRVEVRIAEEAEAAVLEVHDNGPGVPPERRGQIFEALYTTKPNGLGLGLLSVKAALKQHEGRVEVLASPLGGACFRVTLPRK
ncbi:MAG TPA: HAMP domain-containing sensor histidine kinase [Kiritimatiellia bacterium]|nr:HAMP domain-containing sensor histidine kinase [Kiritimatiellia bacterium]